MGDLGSTPSVGLVSPHRLTVGHPDRVKYYGSMRALDARGEGSTPSTLTWNLK